MPTVIVQVTSKLSPPVAVTLIDCTENMFAGYAAVHVPAACVQMESNSPADNTVVLFTPDTNVNGEAVAIVAVPPLVEAPKIIVGSSLIAMRPSLVVSANVAAVLVKVVAVPAIVGVAKSILIINKLIKSSLRRNQFLKN